MNRILIILLLAPVLVLGGCAGGSGMAAAGPGEVALDMFVTGEDHFAVLYQVRPDGTIGFGGGQDAFNRRITWRGDLTEEERRQILAHIREHALATRDPDSTGDPPDARYVVKLRADGRRNSFTVRGEPTELLALRELLERAATRRNEAFLETLPRPSMEREFGSGGASKPES